MPDTPLDPGTFLREQVAPRSGRRVDELRAQIARLEAELADRTGAEATIQLMLEGDGGGTWYMNLCQGKTEVTDQPAAPPVIRVYQTRDDWEALARAELLQGADKRAASPAGDLTKSRLKRLQGISGALEFRLQTDGGERRTLVQFGDGDRPATPRCTLRMRMEDAARLGAGELNPQVAFMQGLVKLEGDLAFAMQVGAALFM